jgi:hypothetical protein
MGRDTSMKPSASRTSLFARPNYGRRIPITVLVYESSRELKPEKIAAQRQLSNRLSVAALQNRSFFYSRLRDLITPEEEETTHFQFTRILTVPPPRVLGSSASEHRPQVSHASYSYTQTGIRQLISVP